jgi:LysM repeat protein
MDGFARKQNVNRENKLAIIIGFSLVLVVAVLISDHFSRARTVEIGSEMKPGTPADFGAGATAVGLTRPIGNQEPLPVHGPLADVEHRVQNVADNSDQPLSSVPPSGAPETPIHDQIFMGVPPPGPVVPDAPAPDLAPEQAPGASNRALGLTPAVPPKPMSRGVMRAHEVKEGDKLYRISAKYYGDGSFWKALAEYNKGKLAKADTLRVGVKLDIPPKDVLLGEAQLSPTPPGARPDAPPKRDPVKEGTGGRPKGEKPSPQDRAIARAKPAKKASFETYKVARGDDLSSIAQKLLGSSKRARELFQLNKDVLDDEHTVLAGTVIKVPAR